MSNALEIKQLTKVYSKNIHALKGIDLEVKQGDFFALLGPNGAGKSTTIGIICSLINKTAGTVKVFDEDIDIDWIAAKRLLGVVPQEFNFSIFETPWQILTDQAGYYGIPLKIAEKRAQSFLKRLDLWHKRDQTARGLSGGMKRRLIIARALLHEPKLLILDEPTAGVDIEVRRSMWDFVQEINQKGTTVILTTHYLEEAEALCKNIAIIDQGKIIENTRMRDLLNQLHTETFIFYLEHALDKVPLLQDFPVRLLDPLTLEVEVSKALPLNALFQQLNDQRIQITSMRNKANRLEELFLRLVSQAPSSVEA